MFVPSELKVLQAAPSTAGFTGLVAENELVVIDLSETRFIDSSFLNSLAIAQRTTNELGDTVLLQVGTEPIVKRLLEGSGFLTHFDDVSSTEEALAWAPDWAHSPT